MIKIGVITSTRAEYGLLYPLITKLSEDDFFDCELIVTGTHLLDKFGHTIDRIKEDKVKISKCISIMSEEINNDPCEIIANATLKFDELYKKEKYDAIVLLGDRFELFGFAVPALFNKIPIIHLHGGEKTLGAIDELIRHSVTKMSSLHFASIKEYSDRIIQMGENADRVFTVGALGIDNIMNLDLLDKLELQKKLDVDLEKNVAVVTYHPVTLESGYGYTEQISNMFDAAIKNNLYMIVTMPNIDEGSCEIIDIINEYVKKYPTEIKFFKSLGQLNYLSLLKYAKVAIGNSSSGILETASFKLPTVNIGNRQKGRFAPENVINCSNDFSDIDKAIKLALSDEYNYKIKDMINPYGDGHAAERIVNVLKNISWDRDKLVLKEFNDL